MTTPLSSHILAVDKHMMLEPEIAVKDRSNNEEQLSHSLLSSTNDSTRLPPNRIHDVVRPSMYQRAVPWLWWLAIVTPIVYIVPLARSAMDRHNGSQLLVGMNMLLCAWMLWTGTQNLAFCVAHFLVSMQLVYVNNGDEPRSQFSTLDMSTFVVFVFQATRCLGKLKNAMRSSNASTSNFPLPTLPISYTVTFLALIVLVWLTCWANGFLVISWIILGVVVSMTIVALLLFTYLSVFLGEGSSCGWFFCPEPSFFKNNGKFQFQGL